MGATFVYRCAQETGAPHSSVIHAFLVTESVVGADELTKRLGIMDTATAPKPHLNALLALTSALDDMTRWFLERSNESLSLEELVERFQNPFRLLLKETDVFLTEFELRRYQENLNGLVSAGFPKDLAQPVAALAYATSYLDIIEISYREAFDVLDVAKLHANLVSEFQLSLLLEQVVDIEANDRWEALALRTITKQLTTNIASLARSVISETGDASLESLNAYLERRTEIVTRFRVSVREFHNRSMTIPALLVIANQLYALSRKKA